MPKKLGYADAVRLLGGGGNKIVSVLDDLATGALLAAAVPVPAVLGLLDPKNELVKLGHKLVGGLVDRHAGLSRYGRTERIAAAHEVIVVTAYFDVLARTELPIPFSELELTKEEQVALAGVKSAEPLVAFTLLEPKALPAPEVSRERYLSAVNATYQTMSSLVLKFVEGLAVWERLDQTDRRAFATLLGVIPDQAVEQYDEMYRRLAVEFPEVAFWAGEREHRATRAEVRRLGVALSEIREVLDSISSGRVPDQRRAALARAHQAELERPVAATGDVPAGLRMPALGQAYVTPRYRAAWLGPRERPSDEAWWAGVPEQENLERFLVGYLTGLGAVRAPLLVLGQPGSGKSVLTKVLAARLPPADFLPVRVVLRDVPATAGLQDQIEYAIRAATGERLEWPALARSAGDALPVVLLDGFDELVQATGVSQSDYLLKVADFQRREADQGRPVAVVVTSRTSVADRATAPEDTVAVRLEPFDDVRVAAWLEVWNSLNAGHLVAHELTPLTPAAVLRHRDLAGQPLLLLMLALYDAGGNALQCLGAELRRDELYERLLRSFARREVTKHRSGLPEREVERAVEDELRRLALVGFAMFNRGAQWVTETDLDADLHAILGPSLPAAPHEMRAPLNAAEIVLGRFFFVHRARAMRDNRTLATYEFLHATFGEFLVARLTWQVLRDIASREAASTLSFRAGFVDDDLLHALLSCAVLTVRAPVVEFLRSLMGQLPAEERAVLYDLVMRLFRTVHQVRPARGFADYGPPEVAITTRHAVYSANLVVLAVCAKDRVRISELFGGRRGDVIDHWHAEALLWHSQLDPEGWPSLVQTLALYRIFDDGRRDAELSIDDGSFEVPPVDPCWTYDIPPNDPRRSGGAFTSYAQDLVNLRRSAHFLCSVNEDIVHHALEPFSDLLDRAINTFAWFPPSSSSAIHMLFEAWMLPFRAATLADRDALYDRCARIADTDFPSWSEDAQHAYATLLLERLRADTAASGDQIDRVAQLVAAMRQPLGPNDRLRYSLP